MVSGILINKVSVKRLSGLVHEVRHAVSVKLEKIQVRQRSVTVLQVLLALRLKRLAALSLYQGPAGLTFKVLVLSGLWQSMTLEINVLCLRTRASKSRGSSE